MPDLPRRGEVYLVRFDPTVGAEIRKTRPAIVLQNDVGNRFGATTIVAAITSQVRHLLRPIQVLISKGESGLDKDSVILLNHVHSFDKQRLLKKLGTVSPGTMSQVDKALAVSVGLNSGR